MTTSLQPPADRRTETSERPDRRSAHPLRASGKATAQCIGRLQHLYRQDVPAAVATLARLRRAAGRTVHDTPDIWGVDGLEDLAQVWEVQRQSHEADPSGSEAPPELLSPHARHQREVSTRAEEEAVHVAVTLWALHQQSVRDAAMHEFGWGLGRAVRALARGGSGSAASADPAPEPGRTGPRSGSRLDDELSETLRKRFVRIGTSTSFDMLVVRLREVVLLLRTARIPLDYARLADQLCRWQNEDLRADVRRGWGRELYLSYGRQDRTEGEGEGEGEDSVEDAPSDGPDPGL